MPDVLVYCPDTAALLAEVQARYPERVDGSDPADPRFLVDKTPTWRNGDETLALVRCRDGEPGEPALLALLRSLRSIVVLGTYDEVLADPELRAIHDRIYPRTPLTWIDEHGVPRTVTPPDRIGAFA